MNNFFINLSSVRVKMQPRVYQLRSVAEIVSNAIAARAARECADELVRLGEHAHALFQTETLMQVGIALASLPLPRRYESIAHYFRALGINRRGRGDAIQAKKAFEELAENAPMFLRARSLVALGTNAFNQSDLKTAKPLYAEATEIAASEKAFDPLALYHANNMTAVIKSLDGDHFGALADLESMSPIVRIVGSQFPPLLHNYLNSVAVELAEVGRLEEAKQTCRITLASPYAHAYPEWAETDRAITMKSRRRSRSVVSIGPTPSEPCNTAQRSVPQRNDHTCSSNPQNFEESSSLLIFPNRSAQTDKREKNPLDTKITPSELQKMTEGHKRALVVEVARADSITEEVLDRILNAAGLVEPQPDLSPPEPNEIDLESPGRLEEMVSLWMNEETDPDEFAAVMSALRDCEDELRRADIIDKMIGCAFRYTREHLESENNWRRRVEARLAHDQSEFD